MEMELIILERSLEMELQVLVFTLEPTVKSKDPWMELFLRSLYPQ